jgi:putative ABC transport system permease protein
MNSWLIFWRNFKHRKLRTLLTLLAIMFSVALVLAVVSTVDTTKKAVPHFVESENKQLDFRVLGKQDLFSVNIAKQIAEVDPTAQLLSSLRYPAKMDLASESRVILTGYDHLDSKLLDYQLLSGDLHGIGLVLSESAAKLLEKNVGDILVLSINQQNHSIPISAIVKEHRNLQAPQNWSTLWNFSISLETLQNILQQPSKVNQIDIKADNTTDISALQLRIEQKLHKDGTVYLQPAFTDLDQTLSGLNETFMGLYLVGTLSLLVCLFILFNTFYVTIQERRQDFAILRTIGFTPNKLIILVLQEIAVMAFISTLPGLALGALLTQVLQSLLFGSYSMYMQVEYTFQNGIILAVICGIGVPILAALIPVLNASRITIAAGLKDAVIELKTRNVSLALFGLLLVSTGILALIVAKLSLPLSFIPIFSGFVIVSPYLLSGTLWLLTPINRIFLGNEGIIASRNITRQITRIGTTSAILALGICLIVVVNSFQLSILNSQEDLIRKTVGGDIALELATPLTAKDMKQLDGVKGVQSAIFVKQTTVSWGSGDKKGNFQVVGVDPTTADTFTMMKPIDQSYTVMIGQLSAPNSIILGSKAFEQWGGHVGEAIDLGTPNGNKLLTVVGIAEVALNNGYVAFTSNEAFTKTFGIQYEKLAFINVDSKVDSELVKNEIVQLYDEKIESVNTLDSIVMQGRSYIQSTFGIMSILLSLGVIIAAFGIVNTLLVNVMDRMREFAMLRAIGNTRWQIRKMIIGEGLIVGTSGILFGIIMGLCLSYLFAVAGNELISFKLHFITPWSTIELAAIFGIVVSLFASLHPASRAARVNMNAALK